MSSDRPRTEPAETPEAAAPPDPAQVTEGAPAEAEAAETVQRKAHPPQAPAALGGMGSTGPVTIVPKRR